MGWLTFLPILVFMGLFVLNLWVNTCQDAPHEIATLTFTLVSRNSSFCDNCYLSLYALRSDYAVKIADWLFLRQKKQGRRSIVT